MIITAYFVKGTERFGMLARSCKLKPSQCFCNVGWTAHAFEAHRTQIEHGLASAS